MDGVDGLNGTGAATPSPDGKHLYLAGFNDDSLAVFERMRQAANWSLSKSTWTVMPASTV